MGRVWVWVVLGLLVGGPSWAISERDEAALHVTKMRYFLCLTEHGHLNPRLSLDEAWLQANARCLQDRIGFLGEHEGHFGRFLVRDEGWVINHFGLLYRARRERSVP